MHYEDDGRRRGRKQGGWEPADNAEARRWHGDEEHRGRRGHSHRSYPGGFGGRGFASPAFPEMRDFGPRMREYRGGRGPRARRGDVRAAALALLAEQPMNGYQIIQQIGERSGGVWRPSPGSVYPALQQLEDEGLIVAEASEGGRRAYQLTDEGRSYAEAHPDELRAPWDVVAGSAGGEALEMRQLIGQVAMAAYQVISAGTETQARQARQQLIETRKALYRILAADDEETGSDAG
jgi:DNA-binding PadR family transcriptional regulator